NADATEFNDFVETLDALIKGQRFHVDVVLPPEMAEKQGETLTVSVKAAGGDKTKIELRRGGARKGRSIVYTHYDEITIADATDMTVEDRDPPLLSVNYLLG